MIKNLEWIQTALIAGLAFGSVTASAEEPATQASAKTVKQAKTAKKQVPNLIELLNDGKLKTVKDLKKWIKAGASLEAEDPESNTILYWAFVAYMLHEVKIDFIKALIDAGCNLNARNKDEYGERTVLMMAAEESQTEFVKLLLDAKADVNVKDHRGWTALEYAAGFPELIKILLEAGAKNNPTAINNTLIQAAGIDVAMLDSESSVKALLEAGADVNVKDEEGFTPLMIAANLAPLAVVQTLLKAGATIDEKNPKGITALMLAAKSLTGWWNTGWVASEREEWLARHKRPLIHRIEIVEELLKAKADVRARDQMNWTALTWASQGGEVEVIKALLEAGAEVDAKTACGETPLMIAARSQNPEAVRVLLAAGAELNAQNSCSEDSALLEVAKQDYSKEPVYSGDKVLFRIIEELKPNLAETLKVLIDAGANPELVGDEGRTALMQAVAKGIPETTKLLIDAKANVNAKDHFGITSLMIAASNGNSEIVRLLLDAKADVTAKAESGPMKQKTALDVAKTEEIKAMLKAAGAKP